MKSLHERLRALLAGSPRLRTKRSDAMSSNATDLIVWWLCGLPNATHEPSVGDDLASALVRALNTSCGFRGAAADHNFVLFKTHKTGSSTLEVMLARHAHLRGLLPVGCVFDVGGHFFKSGGCNLTLKSGVAKREVEMRHMFALRQWWRGSASTWGCDRGDGQWFDQLIDRTYQNIMRNTSVPILIPIRDPESHLQSAMHYYKVTANQLERSSELWNPLAKDFRLLSAAQVERFVRRWLQTSPPDEADEAEDESGSKRIFPIVLEEFDASLVTLRRQLRWDMSDVVYTKVIHAGDQQGASATPVKRRSRLRNNRTKLSSRWTSWDAALYTAFVKLYQHQKQTIVDSTFQQEVTALRRLSMALAAVCKSTPWPQILDVWCRYANGDEHRAEAEACSTRVLARSRWLPALVHAAARKPRGGPASLLMRA